jgi:aryl-alcohol dehydrogenase-like predicted oxidoreductase
MVDDPAVVSAAFDAGINFFFLTADMHWPLYEAARRGLADLLRRGGGIRDDLVIGIVSYVARREFCHSPFAEARDAIPGLDRIDVTIAGGAAEGELDARREEYAHHGGAFGARAFGASFHERSLAARVMAARAADIGFVRFNPVHRGALDDLFPSLQARAPSLVYNFKSTTGYLSEAAITHLGLSSSHWRPLATDYYRYALARPELDGILCALRGAGQVEALAQAVERGPLTDEETAYLDDLADLARGEARLAP